MAIITCCIPWVSSAKIWFEFPLPFGWMEAYFKFFGCSSWLLIVLVLDLVLVVFLASCLLLKISSCCWLFVSVKFCCSIGQLLLRAAVYVLLVLYWLLLLFFYLFSSWFGWLDFTDEFRVCFSGFCSPCLSWRYLLVFFLLTCWIVTPWFLFTCSLILL